MSGNQQYGFGHGHVSAHDARPAWAESSAVARPRPTRLNLFLERIQDRLPVTLQGRWRLDRRSGTVLASVVAVVALITGGWALFRAQSHQVGTPHTFAAEPAAPSGAEPGSASTAVVVDVEGKVAKPGVIRLPIGSRVMDALHAAGGALPGTDLTSLNQARMLNDGEQVVVGAPAGANGGAAPQIPTRPGSHGKARPAAPIHLNAATEEQLEELPGVGPALAQRILDWRAEHGSFSSVGQLQEVRGLGASKFAALRDLVLL